MSSCLQYKAIKNKRTRWSKCFSCGKVFEINQRRNEWRLLLPRCNRYLQGMFWTIQCDECFKVTVNVWRDELIEISNGLEEENHERT